MQSSSEKPSPETEVEDKQNLDALETNADNLIGLHSSRLPLSPVVGDFAKYATQTGVSIKRPGSTLSQRQAKKSRTVNYTLNDICESVNKIATDFSYKGGFRTTIGESMVTPEYLLLCLSYATSKDSYEMGIHVSWCMRAAYPITGVSILKSDWALVEGDNKSSPVQINFTPCEALLLHLAYRTEGMMNFMNMVSRMMPKSANTQFVNYKNMLFDINANAVDKNALKNCIAKINQERSDVLQDLTWLPDYEIHDLRPVGDMFLGAMNVYIEREIDDLASKDNVKQLWCDAAVSFKFLPLVGSCIRHVVDRETEYDPGEHRLQDPNLYFAITKYGGACDLYGSMYSTKDISTTHESKISHTSRIDTDRRGQYVKPIKQDKRALKSSVGSHLVDLMNETLRTAYQIMLKNRKDYVKPPDGSSEPQPITCGYRTLGVLPKVLKRIVGQYNKYRSEGLVNEYLEAMATVGGFKGLATVLSIIKEGVPLSRMATNCKVGDKLGGTFLKAFASHKDSAEFLEKYISTLRS